MAPEVSTGQMNRLRVVMLKLRERQGPANLHPWERRQYHFLTSSFSKNKPGFLPIFLLCSLNSSIKYLFLIWTSLNVSDMWNEMTPSKGTFPGEVWCESILKPSILLYLGREEYDWQVITSHDFIILRRQNLMHTSLRNKKRGCYLLLSVSF